ncbi:metalloendopeptidase, partial [Caerostris extrusa]
MEKGILKSRMEKAVLNLGMEKGILESQNGKGCTEISEWKRVYWKLRMEKRILETHKSEKGTFRIHFYVPSDDFNKQRLGSVPILKWKIIKFHMRFLKKHTCHSEVGRMKRKQLLVLNEANCNDTGSVLHEMMHAIGFTHEHNRPDRDDYIEMLFLNIPY